jgi:hypothetical protein
MTIDSVAPSALRLVRFATPYLEVAARSISSLQRTIAQEPTLAAKRKMRKDGDQKRPLVPRRGRRRMMLSARMATLMLGVLVPLVGASAARAETIFRSYFTGGDQTFVVPPRTFTVHVVAAGGPGAGPPLVFCRPQEGGGPAVVTADLSVTPGETLYVDVGGHGGTEMNCGERSWGPKVAQAPVAVGAHRTCAQRSSANRNRSHHVYSWPAAAAGRARPAKTEQAPMAGTQARLGGKAHTQAAAPARRAAGAWVRSDVADSQAGTVSLEPEAPEAMNPHSTSAAAAAAAGTTVEEGEALRASAAPVGAGAAHRSCPRGGACKWSRAQRPRLCSSAFRNRRSVHRRSSQALRRKSP